MRMSEIQSGWQQPANPPRRRAYQCPHLGAVFAALSAPMHNEGHEWVCGCGQVFVVVSSSGENKQLVKKFKAGS